MWQLRQGLSSLKYLFKNASAPWLRGAFRPGQARPRFRARWVRLGRVPTGCLHGRRPWRGSYPRRLLGTCGYAPRQHILEGAEALLFYVANGPQPGSRVFEPGL